MRPTAERLLADASVVVKWALTTEPDAAQAQEVLLDWQAGVIEVCAPDQLATEVASTLLAGYRKRRLSADDARNAVHDLLAVPIRY